MITRDFVIPHLTTKVIDGACYNLQIDDRSDIQIWPDRYGSVFAYCYSQGSLNWIELPGLANFCFSSTGEQIKAMVASSISRELVRETFYRSVLPLVLQAWGTEVLHASGVLLPQGVVAICGESWSGKSTTAWALSQRGYPLWADDAVAFETSSERVSTLALPFSPQLRPASRQYFEKQAKTPSDRTLREYHEIHQRSANLVALCILKQLPSETSGDVVVRPLSSAQAFAALLSHAYCFSLQDKERKRRMMERYMDLMTRVPAFELSYKPGFEKISLVLNRIESTVHHACRELARYTTT